MPNWWREQLARRPAWMNVLLLFSAYMAFLYVPWDLFMKPIAEDVQVWFGVPFHGWAAKLTTPVHGAVYGLATYGFWRMRRWMWPWAALYTGYLGLSVLIWSLREQGGAGGLLLGLVSATVLGLLAVGLWRSRARFEAQAPLLRERYGEWALVTGASSGIGAAFAQALAREGMSVVLTARREARLRELAAEIEKTHGVATRIVPADLSRAGEPERLADAVSELAIAFLVNNAGFGYQGRIEKQDERRLCDMVQVNCVAPLVLTLRLLTAMRDRGRGAVIFTGSVAGRQPMPLHAVYAATKGFDQLLGEALWAELRASGIDVLVLEPGTTETEFQQQAGEVPHPGRSPEEVVACALEALGRQPSVISDWFNWLRINAGMRLLPRSLLALVAGRIAAARTRPEMQ